MVVFFLNGVAGYEDYEKLQLVVRPPVLKQYTYEYQSLLQGPHVDWRDMGCISATYNLKTGVRGSGETMTFGHLANVLQRDLYSYEYTLMRVNVGHHQWAVSGLILFLSFLPPSLRDVVFLQSGLLYVPMPFWEELLKGWLVAVKRCPAIYGSPVNEETVLMLRKLLNLVVRDELDPDWQADYDAHTKDMQVHYSLDGNWQLVRDDYLPRISELLRNFIPEVLSKAVLDSDLSPIDEWWAKRAQWAPSGSSSDKTPAAGMYQDQRVQATDRPNKKVIFCELPDDYPQRALWVTPRSVGRGSVKNEPGHKDRCLWATDDLAFTVAAYASHNIEKFTNLDGIRAKQMPSDVMEWATQSYSTKGTQRWLSLDYSDYNKEHEMEVLSSLNVELAASWIEAPGDTECMVDKARAALWQAKAHLVKFAIGPVLEAYRVLGGLFSGDRDTARDHAFLHWAYSTHVTRLCKLVLRNFSLLYKNFTGDDEDTAVLNWAHAALYLIGHLLVGHTIKAAKQICSNKYHEYLQRLIGANTAPLRPICTSLGALFSGQWYHDTYRWYDNITQSLSDNLWDCHVRGMPLLLARRLAVSMIDRQMRVELKDGTIKQLEWWVYRHGSQIEHPLWAGTAGGRELVPEIAAKVEPLHAAQLGIDAMIQFRKGQLSQMPFDEDNYRRLLAPEVYSSIYASERGKNHRRFAAQRWPQRYSEPRLEGVPNIVWYDGDWLLRHHQLIPATDRRPTTLDEVLGGMGLDAMFVAAAGGLKKVMEYLPPNKLAKFVLPVEKTSLPLGYRKLDPAIQSVLSSVAIGQSGTAALLTSQPQRAAKAMPHIMHLPFSMGSEYPLTVIYARNGAGKSYYVQRTYGTVDVDDLISSARAQGAIHAHSKTDITKARAAIDTFQLVLNDCGTVSLVGQYPIHDYILRCNCQRALNIIVVDPPEAVITTRLRARGWTDEKINDRRLRWRGVLAAVNSLTRARATYNGCTVLSWVRWDTFPVSPDLTD